MEPEASVPTEQALESTPSTAPSVEREIPANMQPLCIQLGGIKHVHQCQVKWLQEGPINLPCHHLCTCVKGT